MVDEKTLAKNLDKLIKKAGIQAIKNMEASQEEAPEVKFSEEHEAKMREIFDNLKKEQEKVSVEKNIRVYKQPIFNFKRLLLVSVVMIIALFTTVGAVKIKFYNFLFADKEEYSEVGHNYTTNSTQIGNICFDYMPKGFKLENTKSGESKKSISFVLEDEYVALEITKGKWTGKVNTEDGIIEDICINGKEMVYTEKENIRFLTWKEAENTCTLFTNCDKGILMEIASNLKIMQ